MPLGYYVLAQATAVLTAVTIAFGILTTGSGPHAGDSGAARNGLDSELLQHVHSWPAYATVAATVVLLLAAVRLRSGPGASRTLRFVVILFAVEIVQVVVGLAQARLGLPEALVAAHMVLACCLAAAMTAVMLSLRAPAEAS